jgi:hypothetical protein
MHPKCGFGASRARRAQWNRTAIPSATNAERVFQRNARTRTALINWFGRTAPIDALYRLPYTCRIIAFRASIVSSICTAKSSGVVRMTRACNGIPPTWIVTDCPLPTGGRPSIRSPLVEISSTGCQLISPFQQTPTRSPLCSRSAFRLRGCSIQTRQVNVRMRMLYQLQNSAIELDS